MNAYGPDVERTPPAPVLVTTLAAVTLWLGATVPLEAQSVRGTVTDASRGTPVSLAGVHLLDREHNGIGIAMADSLGRYVLTVPDSGEYILVAERFGYRDLESPLLAITDSHDYTLDLELQPAPLGLGEINVTVDNDQAVEWLTREYGINPSGTFGFRLLQGARLAEAKAKAKYKPTETLRWLYIPVSHRTECISINAMPRSTQFRWGGPRQGLFSQPGDVPQGTTSVEAVREAGGESGDNCGTLMVNDRTVPTALLDDIDMRRVAVVITLPGLVRMYTYDFHWAFR